MIIAVSHPYTSWSYSTERKENITTKNSSRAHDCFFTCTKEGLAGEEVWQCDIYFWDIGRDVCEVFCFFCAAYLSELGTKPAVFTLEEGGSWAHEVPFCSSL